LAAVRLRGVVRLGRSELVFEDVQGELGNGRLDSRLELTNGPDGLSARVRIALQDADAAALLAGADQPLVSGRLQFRTELTGSGRSPASFIGSLAGNATVTLEGGQLAGLNPGVFDAVVRATELGIPIEGHRIREFVTGALESAKLPIGRVETAIGVNAGQARFSSIAVRGEGADLRAQASVDLAEGTLDALLTLTGQVALSGGVRPEVQIALKGALPAFKRSVDSSQLSNWLTLLAVDQQAKQLDAIERSRQGRRDTAPRTPMQPERAPRAPEAPPQQPHASGSAAPVEEAPPLPPPVTIPAGPRPAASPPNAAIRPPGLVGAQN
jgi:large subunit ribosomal protein L24